MSGFIGGGADKRAIGWADDNHEQGHIRAKDIGGRLVPVSWRNGQYSTGGTASATLRNESIRNNSDGTCSALSVVVAAWVYSSAEGYATVKFSFAGPTLALRWAKGISTTLPRDFTCVIDGVGYAVDNQVYDPIDGTTAWIRPTGEHCEIIADNLPNTLHTCELVFPAHADQQNRWTLFGYAVDAITGQQPPPRRLGLCKPQALTTSMAVVDFSHAASSSGENYPLGVRKICYSNSTAGAVVVTLEGFYNNATSTTLAVLSVPANGSAEYDFGGLLAVDYSAVSGSQTLRHKAASNSAITATLIGGF